MISWSLRCSVEASSKNNSPKRMAALTSNNAAKPSLSRNVKLRASCSTGFKTIADSANRLNKFDRKILVHLPAQPVDQHIHDIGLRIETVIPKLFQNHCFGYRATWMAQKQFQQREFAGLKFDPLAAARNLACKQIQ